jgi:uncharacterized protein (TIGR00255 family)
MRYEAPESAEAAVKLLAAEKGLAKLLSGGTDLLVQMRSGTVEPDLIVDLKRLPGAHKIADEQGGFRIGTGVSAAEMDEHPKLKKAWPGVVEATTPDSDALLAAGRTLFQQTLDDLGAMRLREGKRLAELIEQRCANLGALVVQVRARLPEIQARIRTRLVERVAELAASVDNERMEQEIALQLQRVDVAEELDRLGGHIEETRRVMGSGEAAGRRLDFLMQELNREANTLASKSQDLDTTRLTVDMKVLIEQMREQVQNVE